jgi:ribosomal protein L2
MLQPRLLARSSQWLPSTRPIPSSATTLSLLRSYATAVLDQEQPALDFSTTVHQSFERPNNEFVSNTRMRTFTPRTPGLRHLRRPINDHLWKGRAHLPLTYPRKGQAIGGRNNTGQVRMRHRGGGHKRRIRMVDFKRHDAGAHIVERVEYDPGRTAHIALIRKEGVTGDKGLSYILASEGMRAGDKVESYRQGIPQTLINELGGVKDPAIIAAKTAWRGNCLPLHMIPSGTLVYNVGLYPGQGGQMCRSAGTYATVLGGTEQQIHKYRKYVNVKLQSGEVRRVHKDACATIGVASNANQNRQQLGKAGRSRWLGIRPTVRGLAMNAADHPHGGGRGKSKGNVHPVSIWGRTPVCCAE